MKCVQTPITFLSSQSMGSTFTSASINALETDVLGIQINYTGSPVGVFTVQGSVDNVNFATLPFSVNGTVVTSFTVPASTSPILLDLVTGSLVYIQVVYTFTSGTGTFSVITTKKRLGD